MLQLFKKYGSLVVVGVLMFVAVLRFFIYLGRGEGGVWDRIASVKGMLVVGRWKCESALGGGGTEQSGRNI